MYRNIDRSKYRNIEGSKYRNIEDSIYRNIEGVLPSIPRYPRVFYADTERKLRCIYQISKSYISTIFLFIDIVSNSIPVSISNTNASAHNRSWQLQIPTSATLSYAKGFAHVPLCRKKGPFLMNANGHDFVTCLYYTVCHDFCHESLLLVRNSYWFFQNPSLELTTFCRPILTQLEFQPVEKVPFSTFAWDFTPKMLEIGLPRLRMSRSLFSIFFSIVYVGAHPRCLLDRLDCLLTRTSTYTVSAARRGPAKAVAVCCFSQRPSKASCARWVVGLSSASWVY